MNGDVANCDGTRPPSEMSCVINEAFGVFVSPTGNDMTGSGTRRAPYATISKGLQAAKEAGQRVYVCDDGKGFAEALTIDVSLDGIHLFGGLDCTTWNYNAGNRPMVKPSSGVALIVKDIISGVTIEDVEFVAPDAVGAGTTSVATIVENATGVALRRVKIAAGMGAQGSPGVDGGKGADGDPIGAPQRGADALCPFGFPGQFGGAWPAMSACGSEGGPGGVANRSANGSAGVAGTPATNVTPADIDNGGPKGGGNGTRGSDGNSGAVGTAKTSTGTFSSAGYSPSGPAGDDTDGFPGQGGGGGGASNATGTCIGASGGAGGMGRCGGKHGTGGGGGGASIAVLSWSLRKTGKTAKEASTELEKLGVSAKNELLFRHGVNFNDVPLWQRRGIAAYWEQVEKSGYDPIRKTTVIAVRRALQVNRELPMKEEYAGFVRALLEPPARL